MNNKFFLVSYDSSIQIEKNPYYSNLVRVKLEDEMTVVPEVFFYNNLPAGNTINFFFRRLIPFDNGICIYPAHQKCIEEEWRKKMTEKTFCQIEIFTQNEIPKKYKSLVSYALEESRILSKDEDLQMSKLIIFGGQNR